MNIKNIDLKKGTFAFFKKKKGLVHDLGKKNSKFFFFCLKVDREKVFGKVLKRKEAFLDHKK